jgi:predicted transcriptional regulator
VDLALPGETARVAAQRMAARNVGTLVVVDQKRRPIGILSPQGLVSP